MAVIKLQPKPYIIESLIQSDDWDWPKALSEFIDNSFGQDAGNATSVVIHLLKDEIKIIDNGLGVHALQQCFALGDSRSRHSLEDIGRFGVGAKHASVWIGKRFWVETCSDSKTVRSACVNWDRVRGESEWPDIEGHSRVKPDGETGTAIGIKNFWPGRKRITVSAVCRQLSETFAPALEDGKSITIVDFRRSREGEVIELVPWAPKGWSDRETFSASVDGRSFSAEVGILSEAYSTDTGLRICYSHRVICRMTKLAGKTMPVRMFGYIRLSSDWKDRLSTNKTQIVDSHDLEHALAEHPEIQKLMHMAEDYQYEMLISNIMPKLQMNLSKAVRLADGGDVFARRRKPVNEGTKTKKHPSPPAERETEDEGSPAMEEDSQSSGLMIRITREGRHIVGRIEQDEEGLSVLINKDCPACKDALDEAINGPQGYYPAIFSVIGSIFSIEIARRASQSEIWLKRCFGLTRTEPGMPMAEAFMNWWMFGVAESLQQEEPNNEPSD